MLPLCSIDTNEGGLVRLAIWHCMCAYISKQSAVTDAASAETYDMDSERSAYVFQRWVRRLSTGSHLSWSLSCWPPWTHVRICGLEFAWPALDPSACPSSLSYHATPATDRNGQVTPPAWRITIHLSSTSANRQESRSSCMIWSTEDSASPSMQPHIHERRRAGPALGHVSTVNVAVLSEKRPTHPANRLSRPLETTHSAMSRHMVSSCQTNPGSWPSSVRVNEKKSKGARRGCPLCCLF